MARLLFIPATLLAFTLIACGGTPLPTPIPSYSAVDGNWNITGTQAAASNPRISTTLAVQGSQITGHGNFDTSCNTSSGTFIAGVGGSLSLSGLVDSTGAFQLTTPSGDSVQITLTGHVPATPGAPWPGTYTLTGQASSTCIFNQSGSVTAQPLPSFTGTYTGSIASGQFPAGSTLSLNLTQGALSVDSRGNAFYRLTASAIVTGTACFTSGSLPTTQIASVAGASVLFNLIMSDGSDVLINGSYTDTTGKTILLHSFFVQGGACNNYATNSNAVTLTRQ